MVLVVAQVVVLVLAQLPHAPLLAKSYGAHVGVLANQAERIVVHITANHIMVQMEPKYVISLETDGHGIVILAEILLIGMYMVPILIVTAIVRQMIVPHAHAQVIHVMMDVEMMMFQEKKHVAVILIKLVVATILALLGVVLAVYVKHAEQ